MAIDNLNYYSAGLPAGQLTDRYSSQPGCLKSKNLDIFSSSKSVKATARSEPTTTDNDVIKQDGKLLLKTDGKVYERNAGVDTLFIDPSTNFPVYDVSYTGKSGPYASATFGTVQDMSAKYVGDERRSFVVYTDRSSFVYSKQKFIFTKSFESLVDITYDSTYNPDLGVEKGYLFKGKVASMESKITIRISSSPFTNVPIRIFATESDSDNTNISLYSIRAFENKYYYDAKTDAMVSGTPDDVSLSFSGDITTSNGVVINVPMNNRNGDTVITLTFRFTKKDPSGDYGWSHGNLYIDMNGGPDASHLMKMGDGTISDGDSNYYYSYLPLRERKLTDIGSYGYSSSYWMKGVGFQPLYKWTSSWLEIGADNNKILYDFVVDMGWESDTTMDVVGMTVRNEQIYMIGNLDGNGYIIPCDLTGGRGTPYIAYGCEFKGVTNIDYLLYLVGEDRGVSTLWVFNGQELVPIIGGKQESQSKDIIGVDEQYKFDGKIINRRKNLILSTTDNRIFQYGQTYGGKGGSFIHKLPTSATITGLTTDGHDLIVGYSTTTNDVTTKYNIKYQDDTPIKNYNTEWKAVYPIVLGNHLLEKEESDLYASYILPASSCKLEFWGMANHYHFWTFTSEDNATLSTSANYKLKGSSGTYNLKFLEKIGNQYTFRLEGDLPVQTTSEMKITDSNNVDVITYSDFNHFRKIGEITTTEYQEGEFRFHNLNNKLELPKSHSLQIMVKGIGTVNYTPELFSVDLVANQRERG